MQDDEGRAWYNDHRAKTLQARIAALEAESAKLREELKTAQVLNHWERMKAAEREADDLRAEHKRVHARYVEELEKLEQSLANARDEAYNRSAQMCFDHPEAKAAYLGERILRLKSPSSGGEK